MSAGAMEQIRQRQLVLIYTALFLSILALVKDSPHRKELSFGSSYVPNSLAQWSRSHY